MDFASETRSGSPAFKCLAEDSSRGGVGVAEDLRVGAVTDFGLVDDGFLICLGPLEVGRNESEIFD